MMLASRWSSALFLVLALHAPDALSEPARGDPDGDVARAVELGRTGLRAYQNGNWLEAHDAFEGAERLSHSPVFLLYIARCKRNQGALLAARESYEQAAAAVPASAPEPWLRAVEDAEREAAVVAARVPSVVIEVESNGSLPVELTLDGKPVAANVEIEVDPGSHRLVATVAAEKTAEMTILVEEKRRGVRYALALPPVRAPAAPVASVASVAPVAAVPPPAPPRSTPPPSHDPAVKARPNLPAYVTGAVGIAGVAVGAITGLVALIKLNGIKQNCVGNHCYPSEEDEADSVTAFANVATAGFVVGGVGLGASAVLFLIDPAAPRAARTSGREPLAFHVTTVF
ncbi:MAG TPA: hypothetical protein VGK73_34455 [Polyangiaceae bacterium]